MTLTKAYKISMIITIIIAIVAMIITCAITSSCVVDCTEGSKCYEATREYGARMWATQNMANQPTSIPVEVTPDQ